MRGRRWDATLAVLPTLALNLWHLRAERFPVQNVNDGAMHAQMVRFARDAFDAGKIPLNAWYPYLQLGSPHLQHYPSLGHMLTALLGYVVGEDRVYAWSVYLLLALWPLAVYAATRILGLGRWAAVAAASVTPLVISAPGYGYEYGSYVWSGWGVWGQLWAMVTLPLALALSWRAVITGRGYGRAAALLGLTMAFHFLTGWLAVAAIGLGALVVHKDFFPRVVRAAGIVAVAVLLASFEIVPLIRGAKWTAYGDLGPEGRFYVDSHGARKVLTWLVKGELYDAGRLPIVTLLVAAGLVACALRWKQERRGRLLIAFWVLSLFLFFGPAFFGDLLYVLRIPGADGLLYHRMIIGVHLAGILLAGVGVGAIVQAVRTVPARAIAVTALVAAALLNGWPEVAAESATSREYVEFQQATEPRDGNDLRPLIERVRSFGDGRVYAGLRDNWGRTYMVGNVPVYSVLAGYDVDAVGFTYRTPSLMADVEAYFDETRPDHYDLFNVRYLLLPAGRQPGVPGASQIGQSGRHTLWSVPTSGYVGVTDTAAPVTVADRESYLAAVRPTLYRERPEVLPSLAYGGRRPAPVTAIVGVTEGRPGAVLSQASVLADGTFTARVRMARTGAALLKVAYDPAWRVTVDGQPAETFIASPGLVGVMVPEGEHVVAFAFRSGNPTWLFLLLGLLALLGASRVSAPAQHQDREEERPQHGLDPEDQAGQRRDDDAQALAGVQGAELLGAPLVEAVDRPADAGEREQPADEQAALERSAPEQPGEARVGGQQPLADGERLGEQREHDRLEPDHHGERGVEQRLHVEPEPADRPAPWDQPDPERGAEDAERDAGVEEQPARAVEQQEAQVPPPVAPGPQVGGAAAPVGAEGDRDLAGTQPVQRGLDDHLAGELHAGGPQVEPEDRVAVEPAQPAVEVADRAAEEHPPEERQDGVT